MTILLIIAAVLLVISFAISITLFSNRKKRLATVFVIISLLSTLTVAYCSANIKEADEQKEAKKVCNQKIAESMEFSSQTKKLFIFVCAQDRDLIHTITAKK